MKRIFSAHNDEDEGLDGLELYKAIKHAKSHETNENGDDQTDEESNVQSEFKIPDSFLFIEITSINNHFLLSVWKWIYLFNSLHSTNFSRSGGLSTWHLRFGF